MIVCLESLLWRTPPQIWHTHKHTPCSAVILFSQWDLDGVDSAHVQQGTHDPRWTNQSTTSPGQSVGSRDGHVTCQRTIRDLSKVLSKTVEKYILFLWGLEAKENASHPREWACLKFKSTKAQTSRDRESEPWEYLLRPSYAWKSVTCPLNSSFGLQKTSVTWT